MIEKEYHLKEDNGNFQTIFVSIAIYSSIMAVFRSVRNNELTLKQFFSFPFEVILFAINTDTF